MRGVDLQRAELNLFVKSHIERDDTPGDLSRPANTRGQVEIFCDGISVTISSCGCGAAAQVAGRWEYARQVAARRPALAVLPVLRAERRLHQGRAAAPGRRAWRADGAGRDPAERAPAAQRRRRLLWPLRTGGVAPARAVAVAARLPRPFPLAASARAGRAVQPIAVADLERSRAGAGGAPTVRNPDAGNGTKPPATAPASSNRKNSKYRLAI